MIYSLVSSKITSRLKKNGLGDLFVEIGVKLKKETALTTIKIEQKRYRRYGSAVNQEVRALLPEDTSCISSTHIR